MGFTFDDDSNEATPVSEMKRLLAGAPYLMELIFPFMGGEELNASPTLSPTRWVINFGERDEPQAEAFPELMSIIRTKVKPFRKKHGDALVARKWWQFARTRPDLRVAVSRLSRVLAVAEVGQQCAFAFLPTNIVYAHTMVLFAFDNYPAFCVLQSRLHEFWARFFSSSMKDDLRYAPSDCFETFPFPLNWENNEMLERVGRDYYEFRVSIMVHNNDGLTKTYNRFHDCDEYDPDIVRLRMLHDAMDRAVLDAYGWTDLNPTCEFILDYEEEESEDGASRKRKKPWRYRWPDDFRDEVLARLLALNQERAEQEKLAGPGESRGSRKATTRRPRHAERGSETLFK